MSIRPSIIDNHGRKPCIPVDAMLAVAERIAEGREPSLFERALKTLRSLKARLWR